ncbi:hypothetical protein CPB83DRAFT_493568 [Crepidotus variabilis]|uniref:F-box domain-containing protein n=1 Tax=Crepidotus variabilis TaxID=179855 RepID=A0A9P6ECK1_9AGAR|nr:hypothetical protein CPB83DRAFT_493568 [Crepidotus variabilis]
MPKIPQELLNEIISNLWDNDNSLTCCSIAHRRLTSLGQKLLFHSIFILHEFRLQIPGALSAMTRSGISLERLSKNSPHIAGYVKALQISTPSAEDHILIDVNEQIVFEQIINPMAFCAPSLVSLKACSIVCEEECPRLTGLYARRLRGVLQHSFI